MTGKRLELALERLSSSQWQRFEKFASEFLAAEHPDLRTVASPSGDDGRDAELFSPVADNTQVLQYSVTPEWRQKISKTANRIKHTIPTAQLLIYVTNQLIGADADALKSEIRSKLRVHLDVRDRTYFLERYHRDAQTEAASEDLARDIVDPYLTTKGILDRPSAGLDSAEAKAAHVYLSLQLRDDAQDKGLTKLSFEALVRAVLIRTTSDNRMHRDELKRGVKALLPNDDPVRVDQLIDSALSRLTKQAVRHWTQSDEFCLTYDESQRVNEYLAAQELSEDALRTEIKTAISASIPAGTKAPADLASTGLRVRRLLERCLYSRAESFASAVLAGNMAEFETDHLPTLITEDLRLDPPSKGDTAGNPDWLRALIREIIASPGEATQRHLRDLADAYTLMAFLRQTPDVQSAVQKMFSHGEIWLDTSAILPLLAEELLDEGRGQFRQMIALAGQAGIKFFVTSGVVEELDRHINRAELCSRKAASWEGRFPFLFEAFLQMGRAANEFPFWLEVFRGPNRPADDIFDFLRDRFGIEKRELDLKAAEAPDELRHAVLEAWYRIHARRRERFSAPMDTIAITRLSKHDTENYVGVIQLRRQEKPSPFGYSAWWLTLDRSALGIGDAISRTHGVNPPDSPILCVDFLAQYLTFGPVRARLSKASLRALPVALEPSVVAFLSSDLLAEVSQIREAMKDVPEWLIRRRIRDHLDNARRRLGPLAARGMDSFIGEFQNEPAEVSSGRGGHAQRPLQVQRTGPAQ